MKEKALSSGVCPSGVVTLGDVAFVALAPQAPVILQSLALQALIGYIALGSPALARHLARESTSERILFEPSSPFLWPFRLPSSPFRFLLALQAPTGPSGSIWPFRHPVWPFRRPVWPFRHLSSACQPSFSFGPSGNFPPWLAGSRETLGPLISRSPCRFRRGVEHLLVALCAVNGPAVLRPGSGCGYLIASRRRVRTQRYRLVGRGAGWANVDIVGPVKREVAWVRVRVWCDWGEVCAPVVGGPCEWVRGVVRD